MTRGSAFLSLHKTRSSPSKTVFRGYLGLNKRLHGHYCQSHRDSHLFLRLWVLNTIPPQFSPKREPTEAESTDIMGCFSVGCPDANPNTAVGRDDISADWFTPAMNFLSVPTRALCRRIMVTFTNLSLYRLCRPHIITTKGSPSDKYICLLRFL